MAVSYSAVRYKVETFSGEKASLLGELSIGGQHLFSSNNTSRPGSQLKAEGSYQQRSYAIKDCYQALLRYRSSRTDNNRPESHLTEKGGSHAAAALKARFGENDQEVGEKQRPDYGPDLSGQRIAYLFAIKAEQTLHTTEFEKLQDFLNTPPETYDLEDLHRKALEKLRISYAAELLESGEPSNKLAAPSGPENAEFGLIMHCQSKEGEIGEFWDIESRSIQTLAEKGLSKDFVFGFNWHWRGETSACGKGPLPSYAIDQDSTGPS